MKTRVTVFVTSWLFLASVLIVTAEDTGTKTDASSAPKVENKKSPAIVNGGTATNLPVICYLEKQDCTITVKAGAKGAVYSVKKADGKVLCENATLEQLRAQAPELHQFIKSAIAIKNGDARLSATR